VFTPMMAAIAGITGTEVSSAGGRTDSPAWETVRGAGALASPTAH